VRGVGLGEGEAVVVGDGEADVAGVEEAGVEGTGVELVGAVAAGVDAAGVSVGVGEAVVAQPASSDTITRISASDNPTIEYRLMIDLDDIYTPLYFPPEALFY
jgi:hypothetical protein